MRKLVSPWKDHLINFYEYKKLCGYKYDSTEYVLVMFDQYYANLKIEDMLFSRDIIEPNGVNLRSWLFFIAIFPIISVYLWRCS